MFLFWLRSFGKNKAASRMVCPGLELYSWGPYKIFAKKSLLSHVQLKTLKTFLSFPTSEMPGIRKKVNIGSSKVVFKAVAVAGI